MALTFEQAIAATRGGFRYPSAPSGLGYGNFATRGVPYHASRYARGMGFLGDQHGSADVDAKKSEVGSKLASIKQAASRLQAAIQSAVNADPNDQDVMSGRMLLGDLQNLAVQANSLVNTPTPAPIPSNFPQTTALWGKLDAVSSQIDQSTSQAGTAVLAISAADRKGKAAVDAANAAANAKAQSDAAAAAAATLANQNAQVTSQTQVSLATLQYNAQQAQLQAQQQADAQRQAAAQAAADRQAAQAAADRQAQLDATNAAFQAQVQLQNAQIAAQQASDASALALEQQRMQNEEADKQAALAAAAADRQAAQAQQQQNMLIQLAATNPAAFKTLLPLFTGQDPNAGGGYPGGPGYYDPGMTAAAASQGMDPALAQRGAPSPYGAGAQFDAGWQPESAQGGMFGLAGLAGYQLVQGQSVNGNLPPGSAVANGFSVQGPANGVFTATGPDGRSYTFSVGQAQTPGTQLADPASGDVFYQGPQDTSFASQLTSIVKDVVAPLAQTGAAVYSGVTGRNVPGMQPQRQQQAPSSGAPWGAIALTAIVVGGITYAATRKKGK